MQPLQITKGKTKYEYARKHAEKPFYTLKSSISCHSAPWLCPAALPRAAGSSAQHGGLWRDDRLHKPKHRVFCTSLCHPPAHLLTASGTAFRSRRGHWVTDAQVAQGTLWRVSPALPGSQHGLIPFILRGSSFSRKLCRTPLTQVLNSEKSGFSNCYHK